jgi:hypothetical protein
LAMFYLTFFAAHSDKQITFILFATEYGSLLLK